MTQGPSSGARQRGVVPVAEVILFKSLRTQLHLLVAAGIVACLMLTALSRVSVHLQSVTTRQALAAKDVTADILPPPLYLVELRLALGMAVEGTLPPALAEAERERLTREYQARVAHWQAHPEGQLNEHLLGPQHEAAQKDAGRGARRHPRPGAG